MNLAGRAAQLKIKRGFRCSMWDGASCFLARRAVQASEFEQTVYFAIKP
jgi:hypothetical protein